MSGTPDSEQAWLLERSVELAAIRAAVEAVAGGEGRAVVIEGPAGIGKSALVAAARVQARALGLSPLAARGTELERAFGFGVVRQLLEPAVQDGETLVAFEGAARYAAALLDVPLTERAPLPFAVQQDGTDAMRQGRRERSSCCTASFASRRTSPVAGHWRCWSTTRIGPTTRRCDIWPIWQTG
jgi:hypothetical protein